MDRLRTVSELVDLLGDWSTGPGPLYRKLATALGNAVQAGDLHSGERLPSERVLADHLTISRATVVAAYDEARAGGLLESRRGSGTRVSATGAPRRQAKDGRVPGGRATTVYQRLIDGPGELISLASLTESGLPQVAEALGDVLREDLQALLAGPGYQPRGLMALRAEIAEHYSAAGVPTGTDQVVVTTGAHQALVLAAQLYLRKSATVVVEVPSWPGCLDVFRAVGARLVGVPLDDEGIRIDGLAAAFAEHQPALLYVMPNYHNPTGVRMSRTRRRRVAELAAQHDVPVLEDHAYTGYVPESDRPQLPIAAYPTGDAEVLTVDSLGKSAWTGLRVGWVRAPAHIADRLARHKAIADMGSPVLDQALAARLLPDLPTLLQARTQELAGKLELLQSLLRQHLPAWRWREPVGGAALWVQLPDTDATILAQLALRHGVEVVPGATTDPSGEHDNFLRLPFTFPEPVLVELVHRLAKAWAELRRHGPADPSPFQAIV